MSAQPTAQKQPSWWQRIFTTAPRGQYAVDEKQQVVKENEFMLMRWNLLFLIFDFIVIPLPLWIDLVCPIFAAIYGLFVGWLGAFLLTVCAVRSLQANFLMKKVVDDTWEEKIPRGTEEEKRLADNLQHLVMMCGYKEPMEVICQSIDSLAAQSAAHRLIVVIGLEEGTPDVAEKAARLKERYGRSFKRFHVTKHPKQWAGGREIRGKCSNANYTMRAAVTRLEEYGDLDLSCTTATSCDTDSIFAPRYFENLGYQFLTSPKAKEVVWQAPLYYNHFLNERPFYVRAIGIMRAAYMLGFLIPFNINTMSIFSFSLDLCIKGEFFHAHYQMDDIIYTLTCMQALQKRIEILMIPMPVISGPTSGTSQWEEFAEWFRQSERWTIGACEVFHYFIVKRRRYNCSAALSYGTWLRNVSSIFASNKAFAALKENGSVVTWGKALSGGNSSAVHDQLYDVERVYCGHAMAALRKDGSVITWGHSAYGGDSRNVQGKLLDVEQIYASDAAFAALKQDRTIVAWGHSEYGGDSSAIQEELVSIQTVQATSSAFAALREDGTVHTWGLPHKGGDSSSVQDQLYEVKEIAGSYGAFAALRNDGAIITWGDANYGGDSSPVQPLIVDMF